MPRRVPTIPASERLVDLGPGEEVAEGSFIDRRSILWLPTLLLAPACRTGAPVTGESPEPEPVAAPPDALSPLAFSAFVGQWLELTARFQAETSSVDAYLYALAALAARVDDSPRAEMLASKSLGPDVEFGEAYRETPVVATQWRLKRGAALRPHNHPPFVGLTLGLEGTCRIRTYRLPRPEASPRDEAEGLRVTRVGDQQCAPRRVVSLVSAETNVHETLPVLDDYASGVDLYVSTGDRRDFSALSIAATPIDPERQIYEAQWG